MIIKKLHFPILVSLLFILHACQQETSNNKKIIVSQYDKLIETANKFNDKEELDSAFYYFEKAKYVGATDEEKIHALYYMASIQQTKCDFSGSEASATEAMTLSTTTNYLPNIYNQLGIAYQEQYDFDNALVYYDKSLQNTSSELYKCILKNNIAVVYLEKEDYNKAKTTLQPLLTNDTLIKYKVYYAKVLDNLGFTYFKSNNPKAFDYLTQSLTIRDSINDNQELIASYMHFSEFYQQSNSILAHQYANKAYQSATKVNSPDDRLVALKFLIASSIPSEAKKHSENFIAINDSINQVRQKAKNQFARIKFDSQRDKEETIKYKDQKENFALGFIVLLIISILSFFLIKAKNKKQQLQTSYNTETRISKKLHDELANDVFHAMTFAETQDLSTTDNKETLLNNLDNIYSRTRNISRENSNIDTGINFIVHLKELMASYSNDQTNIIINGLETHIWEKTSAEKKITTFRIIQELLINMRKHSQCSIAVITFKKDNNNIQIEYTDNGVGTTLDEINLKNGLHNVENRIKAIKGRITFDTTTNKGFKVNFTFPT